MLSDEHENEVEGEAPEDEVEETELEYEQGPPDLDTVRQQVEANISAAAERAAAAQAHAEAIRAWTGCVAANAANPESVPRDDTFDPKAGCGDKPLTPDGAPDDDVDEDAGRPDQLGPEQVGPPADAGPPDWVPGPPPNAGPGAGGDDEGESQP